jgi:very-short-patch-repair endonuclease
MAAESVQARAAWRVANEQHWVVSDQQLRDLGFSEGAIRHRIGTGRLNRVWPGVYAVARRDLTPHGWWMAAVLTCGTGACLSHESAAQLWRIRPLRPHRIEVTVPYARNPRRQAIRIHRRDLDPGEMTIRNAIPTTVPLVAILDLAPRLDRVQLEAAIGDADKHGVMDPERLRARLPPGRRGSGIVKRILDRHTYVLTHTELERRFLAIVRRAGLPLPAGQFRRGPHRMDFFWPELNLVVETDGLTYHRTAAQQSADLRRDHENAAAGLRTLRFSHAQIRYEPRHVERTLAAVI